MASANAPHVSSETQYRLVKDVPYAPNIIVRGDAMIKPKRPRRPKTVSRLRAQRKLLREAGLSEEQIRAIMNERKDP